MERVLMVSGDGHAGLPAEEYRPYVDPVHRNRFDEWVESVALFGWSRTRDEARRPAPAESFRRGMLAVEIADAMESVLVDEGAADAEWDPHRRVEFLESRGVVGEVLYPNAVPLDGSPLRMLATSFSIDEQWAGLQAYNRWLVDFCATRPGRFAGQVLVSFTDLERAVQELQWGRERGLRGVMVPGIRNDDLPWWDPAYETFWAACADLGMVLDIHGGVGAPDYGSLERAVPDSYMRIMFSEATWFSHRPLQFLVWTGVLERHPNLRVAFTEQHSDWIPPTLARMDHSWRSGMLRSDGIYEVLPHAPSEYWRSQCFVGASLLSRAEVEIRAEIGAERMMFGIDFPHPEGAWVDTLGYLRATLGACSVPEAEARRMVGSTATALYGFDSAFLAPIAERVGPTVAEILTPATSEEERTFARTDVFRPLSYA